jgi:hypothetical protein
LTNSADRPPSYSLLTAALAVLAGLATLFAGDLPALAELVDAYFPPGIIGTDARVGVTVATRARPETDPLGVRVGAFTIRPQIGIAGGYDSNPLFTQGGRGSAMEQTSGSLAVTSNWSRNTLSALVTIDDNRFFDVARQDYTNWSASVGKVFEFGTDRLTLTATHLALHQTARDLNTRALDAPGAYQVNNLRVSFAADRGPLFLRPQIQYTGYRYDDVSIGGVRTAQKYRDRDILDAEFAVKFGYALLRDFAVVLRGASIHYLAAQPGQPRPDATTVTALVGLDHAACAVWRYRLLAGVQARQAATSAVKSTAAPVVEASVTWMPTGLTTVGLSLTRALQDAAGEFAAAFTYTEARLAVDHELRRDVLLHGQIAIQHTEYERGGATETAGSAQAGVTWLMNRNMRLSGTYTYLAKRPPTGGSINESIAMVRLQLGL